VGRKFSSCMRAGSWKLWEGRSRLQSARNNLEDRPLHTPPLSGGRRLELAQILVCESGGSRLVRMPRESASYRWLTCLALACFPERCAGDDDDDKPAVAGQATPEAALTIQQQHAVGNHRSASARGQDSRQASISQGVVAPTRRRWSPITAIPMTSAAIVERSMEG